MAEKVETILRRGVFNTRPRDFYDAYILTTTQKFDKAVFAEALRATADHRGTTQRIADVPAILHDIEEKSGTSDYVEQIPQTVFLCKGNRIYIDHYGFEATAAIV